MFKTKILSPRRLMLTVVAGTFSLALAAVPVALAQGVGPTAQGTLNEAAVSVVSMLAMVNTFMHILILIVLNMLQYLLQADYFNDPRMMSALNKIWVLSRNIMNVIFAVMLIGVALYTIITAKSELIKNKIATFILAVVLVNFSWFFPRVIIDVANIMTSTVYSIPNMLTPFSCQAFGGGRCEVITDIKIMPEPGEVATWQENPRCEPDPLKQCPCTTGLGCYYKEDYEVAKNKVGAGHAMINGMATTFIRIDMLSQIPVRIATAQNQQGLQKFSTTIGIVMNVMMTLIIQAGVLLPLLGLAVGFFIRILILWITIAFMPFTFLGLVINGKIGTNIFGFETDVWHEFIVAAFLPVIVAIPMVIGFIMLSTSASVPEPSGFGQTWSVPLLNGVGSWWPYLWMLAAIGILWVGAFTALARSKITGKITDRIKGFGETVFGTAMQIPLIIPLPVGIGPKGSNWNVGTLVHDPRRLQEMIRAESLGIPRGGKADGKIDPTKVAELNGTSALSIANTDKIVAAINKIATASGATAQRDRGDAILQIQSIVGGHGATPVSTLEQLQRIANPDLKARLVKLDEAIRQAREDKA